jgi:hypothetical protein
MNGHSFEFAKGEISELLFPPPQVHILRSSVVIHIFPTPVSARGFSTLDQALRPQASGLDALDVSFVSTFCSTSDMILTHLVQVGY